MDRLKNDVPLWKKEIDTSGKARWVAAKESDRQAGESWSQ
jgi:molybdopterin synthase catalytic subunit